MSEQKENRYHRAKIYRILSYSNPEVPPYYGSTVQSLSKRIGQHRACYKSWLDGKYDYTTSFKLLECEEYHIELVEAVFCDTKDELKRIEGKYILENDCVNKHVAGRSVKEYYKRYYAENRDKELERKKRYYAENRDKELERCKRYRDGNHDKILQYYAENRDKILEYNKQKITCGCGSSFRIYGKARHERTNKHLKWVSEQEHSEEPPPYNEHINDND